MDEETAAFEAACAAEWVDELGVGGEVGVDCFFLLFGRALDELVDYAWGVADWVVHCCNELRVRCSYGVVVDDEKARVTNRAIDAIYSSNRPDVKKRG